jgi:hypothetical protein
MATRNFQQAGETVTKRWPAKGSVSFNPGEIIMMRSGYAIRGATATGDTPAGVCTDRLDTAGATDGQLTVNAVYGGYYVEVDNSTGADAVLATDENQPVYTLNENAVSRLSAGKSKLGLFKGFSADGRVRVFIQPN